MIRKPTSIIVGVERYAIDPVCLRTAAGFIREDFHMPLSLFNSNVVWEHRDYETHVRNTERRASWKVKQRVLGGA